MSSTGNLKSKDFQLRSSFDRDHRLGRFAPDYSAELLLEHINSSLSAVDDCIKASLTTPNYPSIVITGVPRSGTTLLNQLLPSRYSIGYVSNLMARFYKAPLVGAWLQKQLIPEEIHDLRKYESNHGVTTEIFGPHEFGFFWSRHLPVADDCHEPVIKGADLSSAFSELDQKLNNISQVFNAPVLYKSVVAPFFLQELIGNTDIFFVPIFRKKDDVIKSILKVREERLGCKTKWWSVRPKGWEQTLCKLPVEQVEWQYNQIIKALQNGLRGNKTRFIKVSFEDLIQNPDLNLENVMNAYAAYSGIKPDRVGPPIVL